MLKEEYKCAKCKLVKIRSEFHETKIRPDRNRPVTSRCKKCRSDAYFSKKAPGQTCIQCLRPRRLDKNRICKKCNEDTGLRQCRGVCGEILPLYLQFYSKRTVCIECNKSKNKTKKLV